MEKGKTKLTRDLLEIRNRYRRTINDLELFIGDIMTVSKDMIQFIKADPNSKKYATYLSKILKNVQSMNELINKIYNNKNMVNPEPIYVDNSLEKILNEMQSMPRFASIKIIKEFNAADIRVVIDRTEFEELVKHVINNAQEAIESGNGKITVRTTYQTEKKKVRIEIEDNGVGVSPSIRPHIFSRYFTSKEGKEGMGLAVVSETVQSYNGTVDVESGGDKKGALFTVILPENIDLYDEVKYYTNKFYYSKMVENFIKKYLLGWSAEKLDLLLEGMYKLDPGYKCLSKDQVANLLAKKKEYYLGRTKQKF